MKVALLQLEMESMAASPSSGTALMLVARRSSVMVELSTERGVDLLGSSSTLVPRARPLSAIQGRYREPMQVIHLPKRGAASATPPSSPIPPLCQAPRELGPKSTRARQRALPSLPMARQLPMHRPARSTSMEGVATPPSLAMVAGAVGPKEACSIFSLCLPLIKLLSSPRAEPTVASAA